MIVRCTQVLGMDMMACASSMEDINHTFVCVCVCVCAHVHTWKQTKSYAVWKAKETNEDTEIFSQLRKK